jgi:hypothetical protein
MPPERRKFVHDVSSFTFLLVAQLMTTFLFSSRAFIGWTRRWWTKSLTEGKFVLPRSHRANPILISVQLLRRVDTRVPTPLLSTAIGTSAPPPSLGKLADLRALKSAGGGGAQSPSWRPALTPTPKPVPQSASGGPPRGWTSVVARPSSAVATPLVAPKPTTSLGGLSASSGGLARTPTPTHASALRRETPVDRASSSVVVPDNWEDDV